MPIAGQRSASSSHSQSHSHSASAGGSGSGSGSGSALGRGATTATAPPQSVSDVDFIVSLEHHLRRSVPAHMTWYWCVVEAPPVTAADVDGSSVATRSHCGSAVAPVLPDEPPRLTGLTITRALTDLPSLSNQEGRDSCGGPAVPLTLTIMLFWCARAGCRGIDEVESGLVKGPSNGAVITAAKPQSPPVLRSTLSSSTMNAVKPLSTLRIAFVEDEPANCRLGMRLLFKLGIPASNVTVMKDGEAVDVSMQPIQQTMGS